MFEAGFPKVGQVAPLGAMRSKGATWGPRGHNLKLTLDILKLVMKSKKKVLDIFNGCLETYTRYSWVADEDSKKKKVLGVFHGWYFLSNLVEGGHGFFNFFKGGHLQKSLGNSDVGFIKGF